MEKAVSFDQLENSMERVSECINAISGVTDMTGATASAAGIHGLVPQPMAGDNVKFFTGAGTFTTPVLAQISDMSAFMRTLNTQTDAQNVRSAIGASSTSEATTSAAGLMSAADKTKLNGIATGANNYTLPTATNSVLGGVKTGSNITNSSGTISLTKDNVTNALGYTPPTTNTTYGEATTSAAGLMSASDKTKLNGIAVGANAYVLPTAAASVLGGVKIGSNISISGGVISVADAAANTKGVLKLSDIVTATGTGYIKLGSLFGNVIIQWGMFTPTVVGDNRLTFPTTFSTWASYAISCTGGDSSTPTLNTGGFAANYCTLIAPSTKPLRWVAIGT